ncbi:MAG: hypothetical protein FWE17_02240 [Alphaproteobacteria bacterium]|nr:hypothetical protein [Alphaproteobacteria bacterium]MCL2757978.1 hypothetical protein [Alphaproteobacteria bacterium]
MFSRIMNFIKKAKLATVWTALYFAAIWFLLSFMFGFDAFNIAHWVRIPAIRLSGLAGLTFGVLMIATLPIYFAVIKFIISSGKPFPLPFVPEKEKKDNEDKKEKPDEVQESGPALPENLPQELHELYVRALKRGDFANPVKSAFEANGNAVIPESHETICPEPGDSASKPVPSLPIPDFDESLAEPESSGPVFKEVLFDTKENFDVETDDALRFTPHVSRIKSLGFETSVDGDIVIATRIPNPNTEYRFAIAIHDDPDFTIADKDDWFAAGKQRPSPAAAAIDAGARHDAVPVLYLAESNIMDLENVKNEWTTLGVRVISDLSEL